MPSDKANARQQRFNILANAEAEGKQLRPEHLQELQRMRAEGLTVSNGTATNTTEGERKAAAFLIRAIGSNEAYEKTGVGPRSLVGQAVADIAPNVLNTLPAGVGNSPERQISDSAQDEFIAASLRQDSGAAIPEKELERQRRIYFPMPGDSAPAIEQKRQARLRALEGLINSGGRAVSSDIRAKYDAFLKGEEASPIARQAHALTPDNVADFASGLAGGKYELEQYPADPRSARLFYIRPDGTKTEVEVNDEIANSDQYRAAFQQKFGITPALQVSVGFDREAKTKADKAAEADRDTTLGRIDTFGREAANTLTAGLATPVAAAADTIFGSGTMADNLLRQRALDAADWSRNPGISTAGTIAGAAILPTKVGMASREASTAATAAGATEREALLAGRGAATRRLGLEGGAYGTVRGATAPAETGKERLANAFLGGVGGATAGLALGYGGGKLADAFRRGGPSGGGPPPGMSPADVYTAARAENVPINRAMVDPSVRNKMTYLETTRAGNAPIREGLGQTAAAIESGVGRVAGAGTSLEPMVAGTTIRNAAERSIKQSGRAARREYDRAAELAGDTRVLPTGAAQAIRRHIGELEEAGPTTNAGTIQYLKDLIGDMGRDGGITVQGLRALRTNMRGQLSERNLTNTDAERRVNDVLDAAGEDIVGALEKNAPGAAQAFKAADTSYRQRMEFINGTLKKVLGSRAAPLSPEQTFSRFQSMASPKGDAQGLGKMIDVMEPDEAADMVATIAAPLGRDKGGDFSPALLISQAEKLSAGSRLRLFGKEGAESLNNLITVSKAYRDVTRNLNNSRTAVAMNYRSRLGALMGLGGGAAGFMTAGPAGGAGGAALGVLAARGLAKGVENVSDRLSARALMNPDVAKWIKAAPASNNPRLIASHIRKLGIIAGSNPAIAGELTGLRQRLITAAQESPAPAAGQDVDQRRPAVPQ